MQCRHQRTALSVSVIIFLKQHIFIFYISAINGLAICDNGRWVVQNKLKKCFCDLCDPRDAQKQLERAQKVSKLVTNDLPPKIVTKKFKILTVNKFLATPKEKPKSWEHGWFLSLQACYWKQLSKLDSSIYHFWNMRKELLLPTKRIDFTKMWLVPKFIPRISDFSPRNKLWTMDLN